MLTKELANQIYDILVKECSASDGMRESFLYHQTSTEVTEWRFGGTLGFGGKFWINNIGRGECPWYVSCYREDETESMLKVIERTNEQLKELWASTATKD